MWDVKGPQVVPQCVICYKSLSNHAILLSRLHRHLQIKDPGNKDEPVKKLKIEVIEWFYQSLSAEIVKASFEIAHIFVKKKKPYKSVETLIKPCILKQLVLSWKKYRARRRQRFHFRILQPKHLMSGQKTLSVKFSQNYKPHLFFAIQCDETTDIA